MGHMDSGLSGGHHRLLQAGQTAGGWGAVASPSRLLGLAAVAVPRDPVSQPAACSAHPHVTRELVHFPIQLM
ncbi:unnamed protein product [Rangifer tarandus platyrhynchus]|uniref:Uncharacterized protein n=1 Tax=Rangifer tarandus platyrhynchus TaxID=3082113 RepID=A0AC59ZVA5_RANTA